MNDKTYNSGLWTWTQPYPTTYTPPKQAQEDKEEITDLTEANDVIARIKSSIRN